MIEFIQKFVNFSLVALILYGLPLPASINDVVIFYHIPKTGGTTVSYLLSMQFNPELICQDNFYYEVETRSIEDLNKFKFFRGHFFYCSNLKGLKNSKKIVFLRDPIQRVLSDDRFLTIDPVSCLNHFLPVGKPSETISNQACLFLSGLDRNDPMITPKMHYESARENLVNDFYFIGLTEYFEESIQVLYLLMGWKIPENIPRLNFTIQKNQKIEIDPWILEEIKQRNVYDIKLYEYAKRLYMDVLDMGTFP